MAKQDYYECLGVSRDADAATLKKAYRKLAMDHHPDRNPGDAEAEKRFKELSEAYEVLKDDDKRAAYDRFGHAAFEGGGPGPGGFGGGGGAGGFADIFEEMFGDFMGGRGGQRASAGRGSDLRFNMEITLEDAFNGLKTEIRVLTAVVCDDCKGSGGKDGASPAACGSCGGAGRVRQQSGFFTVERTCPTCQGTGQTIKDPCRGCGGSGRKQKEKTLSVNIPSGVEDGTRIRLASEGEAGLRGAPTGDLYIFLAIKPHRFFRRDGADIHVRVPVPMATATLGGQIEVPTVEGKLLRVSIPEGTPTGHQLRLRSKGMKVLRSESRGDMFVQIFVETPVNLTKKQKELLKEFTGDDKTTKKHSPESTGFLDKVKELWEDLRD
ncbi:MAG: molecular chaperone DnaJ [Rhodospirillales bacterium]|nr:molecular chaperone DnaJ [Rhodospirillales bacterium]